MTEVVYDLESASLDWNSQIYCNGVKVNDEPTQMYTCHYMPNSAGSIPASIQILVNADINIGHNNVAFDSKLITTQYDVELPKQRDTMLIAKLMYPQEFLYETDPQVKDMPPDLYGSYSLKAFGYRFGLSKLDFEDWSRLSAEMMIYGMRDVDLTYTMYQFFRQQENYPPERVLDLEHDVASILAEQQHYGFYFDIDMAKEFSREMLFEKFNLEKQLQSVFKPKFLPDGPIKQSEGHRRTMYIPNPNYKGWFI